MEHRTLLTLSWIGTAATWVTSHISTIVAVVCGIASLIASYYTIKAKRAEAKLREQELQASRFSNH